MSLATSNNINSGDIITISAINWVANKSKQTFLYATPDKNWFGNDNNVTVVDVGNNLDTKYLFKINKCSGSGPIYYGDRVNLQSLNNKYIQCGGGTCNSGNNPSCTTNDWQVFVITSPFGRTGNLHIGDTMTFNQESEGHCSILPADNTLIWCGSTNNNNQYLAILLPNGTNGISSTLSQLTYDSNRTKLLTQQEPIQANTQAAINTIEQAVTSSPTILYIILAIMILGISILIIFKLS
jgi:hypothetical protein